MPSHHNDDLVCSRWKDRLSLKRDFRRHRVASVRLHVNDVVPAADLPEGVRRYRAELPALLRIFRLPVHALRPAKVCHAPDDCHRLCLISAPAFPDSVLHAGVIDVGRCGHSHALSFPGLPLGLLPDIGTLPAGAGNRNHKGMPKSACFLLLVSSLPLVVRDLFSSMRLRHPAALSRFHPALHALHCLPCSVRPALPLLHCLPCSVRLCPPCSVCCLLCPPCSVCPALSALLNTVDQAEDFIPDRFIHSCCSLRTLLP